MIKLRQIYKILSILSIAFMALTSSNYAESVQLEPQTAVITSANVNIRSGPATKNIALLQIPDKNVKVTVLEKDGNWYKIDYKGNKGWITRDFVSFKTTTVEPKVDEDSIEKAQLSSRSGSSMNSRTDALRIALVESAKKCVGIPYVWGGYGEKGNDNLNPENGMDCSGFIYYIYSIYNIKLNGVRSTAASQATEGIHVDKEDLKPGDLIFFQGPNDYEISHVAMYIGENEDGVGEIIHASSYAKQVTINPLSKQPNYKTARRIIQD